MRYGMLSTHKNNSVNSEQNNECNEHYVLLPNWFQTSSQIL